MTNPKTLPLTVAIPTYRRERVLIDTLEYLLAMTPAPAEILVIDQTEHHDPHTVDRLRALAGEEAIRWIQRAEPSIPSAMNHALLLASEDVVLFVDDDIRPEPGLLVAHLEAHEHHVDTLVAGRVIQPWEEGHDFSSSTEFRFAGLRSGWIREFMGGNFSVRRGAALSVGGFDENFVRVAYRFEAEFAHRFLASGRRVWFEPTACLHHLKDAGGGTRTFGNHLTTWRPDHAVGAYYFALRAGRWRDILIRPARALLTKHHLRRPWFMVTTLWAEVRGLAWALRLSANGPRYVRPPKVAAGGSA